MNNNTPPDSFLLLRRGENPYTVDGKQGSLSLADDDIDRLIAEFEGRAKELVIDYEHQTITGQIAPAAGWIDHLSKTAEGIVAHVRRWTEKAAQFLESGEYRYFSPVVFSLNGHPAALHSVALTNHPAIHGIAALAAADIVYPNTTQNQGVQMETLRKIADALGMSNAVPTEGAVDESTFIDSFLEQCRTMRSRVEEADAFLKLHECPDFDSLTLKIKGMISPEKLASLSDKVQDYEAEEAVARAFADGKLTEAQRPWALAYAKKNLAAFSDFIATSPVIAPGPADRLPLFDGGVKHQSIALGEAELRILRASGANEQQIERIRKGE